MPAPCVHLKRAPTSRRYLYAALTHWSVFVVVIMAGALTMLSVTLALAAAFLGELAVLGVLLRTETFRKRVDAQCERYEAAAVRAALLEQMSAPHRGELEQLERLAVAIRKRCGQDGKGCAAATDVAVEHWLELEKLLSLYIQTAIAHRDATISFPAEEHAALVIATEQMRVTTFERGGSTEACLRRRAAILQSRRENWTQAVTERDLLAQELSTVVDLVHWMHEVCAVARGGSVRLEMERVLASWEHSGDALREVSTLCRTDGEPLDPATMALGREELARREEVSRRQNVYASKPSGESVWPPGASGADASAAASMDGQNVAGNKAEVVALRARSPSRLGGAAGGVR